MKNIIYVVDGMTENQLGEQITYKDGILFITGSGFFAIDTSFTFQGAEAGVVSVTLLKNGKPIKSASQTLPCSGAFGSVSIPTILRGSGCDDISFTISGADIVTWSIMAVEI